MIISFMRRLRRRRPLIARSRILPQAQAPLDARLLAIQHFGPVNRRVAAVPRALKRLKAAGRGST